MAALGLLGCAEPEPTPEPPPLAPPPAAEQALEPEEVVEIATQAADPADAIRTLDRHPFAFELGPEVLEWLEAQVPTTVQDYLRKRSQVDWGALRGDVDPDRPR